MEPSRLPYPPYQDCSPCGAKASVMTIGLIAAGLLLPQTSLATGFGMPQGEPVIGAPLALEIEVLNPERSAPECFEIKPIGENGYFPRRPRLELKKKPDGKTFLVVSGGTVQEPVIEFRLRTSCGTEVERRYTLLAAPPRELMPAPVALPVTPLPAQTAQRTAATGSAAPSASGMTLDQLARQRYPLQPKAREKFKRLLKSANPELALADDEALPVDPSALHYPENLPERRYGPYRPPRAKKKTTVAPPQPPAQVQAAASAASAPSIAPASPPPSSDRLVIGSGSGEKPHEASAQESGLAEKAESSFTAQQELISRLDQAEQAYKTIEERLKMMEERMHALELEKQQLQRKQETLSQSALIEMIIAVIMGGALGALATLAWLRRKAMSGIGR